MKHWCGFLVNCEHRSGHDAIAASVAVVTGFISIIWFAAARRTGAVVSDKVEDTYGRKLFG